MRTINKKRAELLTTLLKEPENEQEHEEATINDSVRADCKFDFNGLASILLQGTHSIIEKAECIACRTHSMNIQSKFSAGESLNADFSNFVGVLFENFPEHICGECNEPQTVSREFGNFVFIEVFFNFLFF